MELVRDVLLKLSTVYGPSGNENKAACVIEDYFSKYTKDRKRDALGNVLAVLPARSLSMPKIMIDAHYDEVSMLVTGIDENGFVKFSNCFGMDARTLLASEMIIHGEKEVFGIASCLPPHLLKEEDAKKMPSADEFVIDAGYSAEKLKELIKIGDSITYKTRTTELKNGHLSGKSLDNRAGVAAIICCLEMLRTERLDCELIALASVQEEAGTRGAKTAAYTVNPDVCIVLDVSFATCPDTDKDKTGEQGKGVMIGFSPILKRELSDRFISLAKQKNIKYQIEAMAGDTGTNAASVQIARSGIATGLLSIPLKYMHTQVETVMLSDIEDTARLLCEYIKSIKGGGKLW